jgi:hypothetical protein
MTIINHVAAWIAVLAAAALAGSCGGQGGQAAKQPEIKGESGGASASAGGGSSKEAAVADESLFEPAGKAGQPIKGLEIPEKGQLESVSISFTSFEGDRCGAALSADGWVSSNNSCWSGFSCGYAKGSRTWPVKPEKVLEMVKLLSGLEMSEVKAETGGGKGSPKAEKGVANERTVKTSLGSFVLTEEGAAKAQELLDGIIEDASKVKPLDAEGKAVTLPVLSLVVRSYDVVTKVDIEESGSVVLSSGNTVGVDWMAPGEVSKLEEAVKKVPASGFMDGEASAYTQKGDPDEKLLEMLTVGDRQFYFFREKPPADLAPLVTLLESIIVRLLKK